METVGFISWREDSNPSTGTFSDSADITPCNYQFHQRFLLSHDCTEWSQFQGGYTANLAPAKLVGKLLNFFDSTAHRVVGGLPPPVPTHGNIQANELHAPRVSSSQSTMTMSSLIPSASMEPITEWAADGTKMTLQNRSVSEPDFGRTPRQVRATKWINRYVELTGWHA